MRVGTMEALFQRYGSVLTVESSEGNVETRAFLQPILGKSKNQEQWIPTPLGRQWEDRFLYLGPAEVPLQAGGRGHIQWGERRFEIVTAHPIYIGREISHWWAVLAPTEKEDQ